jgi:protein O-mannosyl-transferase
LPFQAPSRLSPAGWGVSAARWGVAGIVLLTMIAYFQAAQNRFIWDDDFYVTENATLRDAGGLARIWIDPSATPQYYPVVHTTFWIEYHLWGVDPAGYHVVNIALHAASAGVLFFLLRRWRIPGGDAAAWLAAALFAVHPVQAESVAWITERKNVLSGLFYLLALWQATRAWNLDQDQPAEKTDLRAYGLAALFFILALLSKSVTASLPAAILLVVWWKRARIALREWLYALPLLALGMIAGAFTAYLERQHVGARGPGWDLTGMQRTLIAGRAAWMYVWHLVYPSPLIFFYPRWKPDNGTGWQYLFPVAAIITLAALWIARKRIGRGPPAAALFFGGTLFPALGFLNVYPFRYSYVADHFQYLACLGVLVPAACAILYAGRWMQGRLRSSGVLPVMLVPALLVAACVVLTIRESYKYADELTLWTATAEKNPTSWAVYSNLGMLQMRAGKLAEAERSLQTAIRLDEGAAETRGNLGAIYLLQSRLSQAEEMFRQALQRNPQYEEALRGLGAALALQKRSAEAIGYLESACREGPKNAINFSTLGEALNDVGRTDDAIAAMETALRLDPSDLQTRLEVGQLLYSSGRRERGAAHLREVLRVRPEMTSRILKFMQGVDQGNATRK